MFDTHSSFRKRMIFVRVPFGMAQPRERQVCLLPHLDLWFETRSVFASSVLRSRGAPFVRLSRTMLPPKTRRYLAGMNGQIWQPDRSRKQMSLCRVEKVDAAQISPNLLCMGVLLARALMASSSACTSPPENEQCEMWKITCPDLPDCDHSCLKGMSHVPGKEAQTRLLRPLNSPGRRPTNSLFTNLA